MAYIRPTTETPGWQNGIKSLDAAISKLTLIRSKAETPQPALNAVAEEFALMEAQRFMFRGKSSFATKEWQAIQQSTIDRRQSDSKSNHGDESLVARGYLANTASKPKVEFFGRNSMALIIDPSGKGREKAYTRGHNYGAEQQKKDGFKFVTITPEFLLIARTIVERYILNGVIEHPKSEQQRVPSDTARGDIARGIRERKAVVRKQKKSLAQGIDKPESKFVTMDSYMKTIHNKRQVRITSGKSPENMSRSELQQNKMDMRKAVSMAQDATRKQTEKLVAQYSNGDAHMRTK